VRGEPVAVADVLGKRELLSKSTHHSLLEVLSFPPNTFRLHYHRDCESEDPQLTERQPDQPTAASHT
jgi:hypothetical protein